ncbi:[FeFe] hydrogenase H-cluster radical SAM maturase HydE [Garciella nitratireducens]|uniref:Iron-only hydrogenase maturation protein HydE n=1 Tax=Garciella nitratireducens DSM 15102 TaxID=1121911 RepID=A0A1T4KYL3_9FIRM|nr:[FeFe] hydrogenase H-cluster radical SAM maturase HydE [Garciella nitratireducens]RBP38964.1 iron-only hydrogenase maturation protein HydE [Garciella nitratireducens]SJZ47554.1 iron-only hydrogenase maturation protein HydE [Garciella nitratireducens DSM 15102]
MKLLIDELETNKILSKEGFVQLIIGRTPELTQYLFEKSRKIRQKYYQKDVYIRGLIEFTNYCKNDCYYCGIRRSNRNISRYRLTKEQILQSCETGYHLGFRTFVLQGGEDNTYDDDKICDMVYSIKQKYPDCAVTLSLGEKSYKSYLSYYQAGADRYLLRHETASEEHYKKLHPSELSLENRKQCLWNLKKIGYQVGTGFMVGSPYQTPEDLAEDLLFIHKLQPEMVGIGPFIPHQDTPFAKERGDNGELTLFLLAILRLMLPSVLLPATTALGTIDSRGREKGILAGANVVMPNLSPINVREKYLLYDNKICTGDEAAECRHCLQQRMQSIGYHVVVNRGDFKPLGE